MYTSSFAALKTRRNREIGPHAFMEPGQTLSDSRSSGQKHCQRRVQPPIVGSCSLLGLDLPAGQLHENSTRKPPENSLETECVYMGVCTAIDKPSVCVCTCVCIQSQANEAAQRFCQVCTLPGVHDESCQTDVPGLHRQPQATVLNAKTALPMGSLRSTN